MGIWPSFQGSEKEEKKNTPPKQCTELNIEYETADCEMAA